MPHIAIQAHKSNLRSGIIFKEQLIVCILQQILIRARWCCPFLHIFLNHRACRHMRSLGRIAPTITHRAHQQPRTIRQPDHSPTKNLIQFHIANRMRPARLRIADPKINPIIPRHRKSKPPPIGRPISPSNSRILRQPRHRYLTTIGNPLERQPIVKSHATLPVHIRIQTQTRQTQLGLRHLFNRRRARTVHQQQHSPRRVNAKRRCQRRVNNRGEFLGWHLIRHSFPLP